MTAILINDLDKGGAQRSLARVLKRIATEHAGQLVLVILNDIRFQEIPSTIEIIVLTEGIPRFGILSQIWALIKLVRQRDIDRVQSHLYRSNFINIVAKMFGRSHCAWVVNSGRAGRLIEEGLRGRITLLLQKILYPRANGVICKAYGMASDLAAVVPGLTIDVIPNGYDISEARHDSTDLRPSEEFSELEIVSIGRLVRLKRHDLTIRAFSRIVESGIDARLRIFGEGQDRDFLEGLIAELGLAERASLSGYSDHPYTILAEADILVSSSSSEGFPNVLVEAMISGCAVISTDCISGPREILAPDTPLDRRLRNGLEITPYGILTTVDDIDALVEALKWMADNAQDMKKMTERSWERAQEWDIKKTIRRYEEILFPKDTP